MQKQGPTRPHAPAAPGPVPFCKHRTSGPSESCPGWGNREQNPKLQERWVQRPGHTPITLAEDCPEVQEP